jgi:membrane peptidoglycan carboxypeptidase
MAYAMRGAFETGGTAKASKVKDCRPAAGKTGTSNLGAHTWFTGCFPNLLASVWVGDPNGNVSHMSINFEGRAIHPLYGSSLAAPLWKDFMDQIVDGIPVMDFPDPDPELAAGVQVLLNPGGACDAKQPGSPGTLGAHPGVNPATGMVEDTNAAHRAGVLDQVIDPSAAKTPETGDDQPEATDTPAATPEVAQGDAATGDGEPQVIPNQEEKLKELAGVKEEEPETP